MKKKNYRRKKQFSIALQKIYKDFLFTIKDSYKNTDYLKALLMNFQEKNISSDDHTKSRIGS